MSLFKTKKSGYPEIVQQIHKEFETASDVLVAECDRFIQSISSPNFEKAQRLERIGFKNVKEVAEIKSIAAELSAKQSVREVVNCYRMKYPNNKFITEDQVQQICEKYNLVNGPIERYKGFVPETKLSQIEAFQLDSNDIRPNTYRVIHCWYSEGPFGGLWSTESSNKAGKCKKALIDTYGKDTFDEDDPNLMIFKNRPYAVLLDGKICAYIERVEETSVNELHICAPKKDMDLDGLKQQGKSFFKFKTIEIPDPVVLQPVRGGYLILAMWADENFDPHKEAMLINETMN